MLVHSFTDLDDHARSMMVLQPASGPLAALRTMIHTSLVKIEAVHKEYAAELAGRIETEPSIHDVR